MKGFIRIDLVRDKLRDPKAFEKVRRLCPEAETKGFFGIRREAEDPLIRKILDTLRDAGKVPGLDRKRDLKRKEFAVEYDDEYEHADCLKAPFLVPIPNLYLGDVTERTGDDQVVLDTDGPAGELNREVWIRMLKGKLPMLSTLFIENPIVSGTIKRLIKEAGLTHARFDNNFKIIGSAARRIPEKYSVLNADLELPDYKTKQHTEYPARALVQEHGFESLAPHRLFYTESTVRGAGQFDFAVAGVNDPNAHLPGTLVVSNRFYRLAIKAKCECIWLPVHLEP